VSEEEQLVIDPCFFFSITERLPQISSVQVEPKRGRYHNELTRFRYEVILHVRSSELEGPEAVWLDWKKDNLRLPELSRLLQNRDRGWLGVTNIPNARLTAEIKACELLAKIEGLETAADLRKAVQSSAKTGVDPENIHAIGNLTNHAVQLHWAGPGADDSIHALFRHRSEPAAESVPETAFPLVTQGLKDWRVYTNDPQKRTRSQELVSELRRFLLTKLPEYMVPATISILDSLPLTANGKLDRRALPTPGSSTPNFKSTCVSPRTQTEEGVAAIWTQLLGSERIGVDDNFFELGGHSLLAMRLLSRVRTSFDVEISLQDFFEASTIAGLAELIEQAQFRGVRDQSSDIVRVSRHAHTTTLPGGQLSPADLAKGLRKETRTATGGE
jgi:acyl carrier protein